MAAMSAKSRRVPVEQRQRTQHSCDRCKSRKQKCTTAPGQDKCNHCLKYGYTCIVTKPRKQRLYGSVESHGVRVAVLEGLVKGFIPEADIANVDSLQEMGRSLGIPLPEGQPSSSEVTDEKENEQLVHDLQGQNQYIGRSSSYFFQMKLRALVGRDQNRPVGRMYLFGPNPANSRSNSGTEIDSRRPLETVDIHSIASPSSPSLIGSPEAMTEPTERSTVISLVRAFFDRVNIDFPVLHEAAFLEQLDSWFKDPTNVDHVWVCSFLSVLSLGRRHCDIDISEEQADRWWSHFQILLSKVMFTSSLASIQALMLAALHLHNTNSRDVCWTLTGAAARIGFAIGLHRDDIETDGTPLMREMRKRVWWTLYAFEQLQVSSHDRESAIQNAKHLPASPREGTLGMGTHNLPDYVAWSNRLSSLLGTANALPEGTKEDCHGPLSPTATLLRDLTRWRASLPPHLSPDAIDTMPAPFQRSLILLHTQYHYTVSLICRGALLSRFTSLSKERPVTHSASLETMSDTCIESGRVSCQLLVKLDSFGNFNAVTWLDVYYLYSSTLVLVLSLLCDVSRGRLESCVEKELLLDQCTRVASKHLDNSKVPGTMQRWLSVVRELAGMVRESINAHGHSDSAPSRETRHEAAECSRRLMDEPCPGLITPGQSTVQCDERGTDVFAPGFKPFVVDAPQLPEIPNGLNYDFVFPADEPSESRTWQEMYWEDISDMLLGGEARNWYM
ncbi:hypothetical protein BU26DRAFT_27732 [Trematosphaeria pertusa]|uniref:Zn(2)-C6 fungal-type domain-containing protein n=1 Tax=Trematosphaeria pertusa TaxID=390896 RepID=A0A6A6J3A2_9PLEO|nr:uncharacterized protein BU26DRAFT_27732 [Trematosphaeria pertusa]KAF2256692.1 hypothetical protein BU26DRAFT_27732 [Trematosphaeria pertusa]